MPSNYHPCNHDCIHCTHADCICNDGPTKWESAVLSGALGRWEHEMLDRRIVYLKSHGYGEKDIISALSITQHDLIISSERIRGAKIRAARVSKRKAAQRKLHNDSIST